jgi:CDP-diacylglycerol--serine O-phosphatidyltransferase
LFLPKLQPRKNKIFNTFQAILIVITYISAFFFVTDTIPFLYEYLLLLVGGYLTIGLAVGFINRKKIIAEAKAEKEKAA